MSIISWMNDKVKNYDWLDIGCIKWGSMAFALLVAKLCPAILGLEWFWYGIILAVLLMAIAFLCAYRGIEAIFNCRFSQKHFEDERYKALISEKIRGVSILIVEKFLDVFISPSCPKIILHDNLTGESLDFKRFKKDEQVHKLYEAKAVRKCYNKKTVMIV